MIPVQESAITGYVEGWYGRLFEWEQRKAIVESLVQAGLNCYWYAPKEDPQHRFNWREPYSVSWRSAFQDFCAHAHERAVSVIAGMAPGADIDLGASLRNSDVQCLCDKTQKLLDDGAHQAALLLDDIDPLIDERLGDFRSEGQAHACLANVLGDALGRALLVVPRIYANELHAESPDYLADFVAALDDRHVMVLCGSDIVSECVTLADCRQLLGSSRHRIVVWDNVYANDYCPRRLFVGPWRGRSSLDEFVLNPTGLPFTDALLIDVLAAERQRVANGLSEQAAWRAVLDRHGVPKAFDAIADFFDAPIFNTKHRVQARSAYSLQQQLEALDTLTWRWKSALAREWFPYLMSLRHDLLIEARDLPWHRVRKTQSLPLSAALSASVHTSDN